MKAIEESHMAVIIFSEDYASSSWCLEELAKIMECKEERNLMVFPVFYKVEPREVRTPRERYKKAMVKHESKFGENSDKVKRWKQALLDAGSLSGWHLKDEDDSEHIQRIVKEIAAHLGRTPLHVAKHPVGIDSRVVRLKSMLNLESDEDVLMVGLWGQGGIGKTALAKAVFNDISREFEGSCFLANVREDSKDCKDLVTLQEKLLSEILLRKQRLEVYNVDAGTRLVQERLCCKKVLLILDDVDDLRQLNALAGECKWFGNGSRIIFTTRDKHLLTSHGINQDQVYEVQALDDDEAHELLSKHAFLTHQNFKIRIDLVDSVLNHAKGLPLALEVLGSFLCGRREHEWESALEDISTAPKKGINDVLKISYVGLEPKVKEIFLHIACFFKRWGSEYVKKVLNSCDLNAVIGLEILKERSLIRIELGNIHMHDLIQLMGMDIVNQESNDPRRRSRLWLYNDVVNVVSSEMENCAVKAIVLDLPEPTKIFVGPDALTKMRTLRLLILLNVHNTFQDPICVPNELRWFRWDGCAPPIPEYSYGEKKLVGLDMSYSSITVVPNQFKDFQNLTYINFNSCKSMDQMPDFSCSPNLKELNFGGCKNLVEAHESIAYLDKLEMLNLGGCHELSVFPKVLYSKNLRGFYFIGTKFERFPDIPHQLKGFEMLSLIGSAIKELPTSIENLVALKSMFISGCKNLRHLPSSIYKLQNLEDLQIINCPNLIGFPKYGDSADSSMKARLPNLHKLYLSRCNLSEVEFLENLSCMPLLSQLTLEENNILTLPTSISKRDSLSVLRVDNCHQLQEIPELPPFLRHFFAVNCESLQKNEDLIPIHRIVRASSGVSVDFCENQLNFIFPQGEMPRWVFPIEEDSIFFMVSEDLYDKILGVAICTVLKNDENVEHDKYSINPFVNGEWLYAEEEGYGLSDLDHIAVEYFLPCELWGEVDFAQINGRYIKLGVGVEGGVVEEWGLRIVCKQLGDDLKVELQDNQLINLALLHEDGHESTDVVAENSHTHGDNSSETDLQEESQDCQTSTEEHSQVGSRRKHEFNPPLEREILALLHEDGHESTDVVAENSHMHGDNSSEADLQEDWQDCQMSTEEHSQVGSKRKHEFNPPLGKRIKTMLTSIWSRWRQA